MRFKIVYCEKLNFRKQVKIFSKIKTVVGLTGAGLANMLWMPSGSTMINIRPENDPNIPFSIFSNHLNIKYYYYLAKKTSKLKSTTHSDFEINIDDFLYTFKDILNK